MGFGNFGTYNWTGLPGEENLNPPSPPTGGIPSEGHIKEATPTKIQDTNSDGNKYYTSYWTSGSNRWKYYNQVTTIYKYTYNGTTYYLKDFTDLGGNHS